MWKDYLIKEKLKPCQFCCPTAGGLESLPHAVRRQLQLQPNHILIENDFKNAFNTINKKSIIEVVDNYFPNLRRYVRWSYCLYENESPRICRFIDSKGTFYFRMNIGTVQGSPLSSNLFNIAQEPILQQLRQQYSQLNVKIFSIHDGHFIIGPPEFAFQALKTLHTKSAAIGLTPNPNKIRAFAFNNHTEVQHYSNQ